MFVYYDVLMAIGLGYLVLGGMLESCFSSYVALAAECLRLSVVCTAADPRKSQIPRNTASRVCDEAVHAVLLWFESKIDDRGPPEVDHLELWFQFQILTTCLMNHNHAYECSRVQERVQHGASQVWGEAVLRSRQHHDTTFAGDSQNS